ncbi:MAG TPA: four helix bundle protein, partial [Anaerolineae bacterium]
GEEARSRKQEVRGKTQETRSCVHKMPIQTYKDLKVHQLSFSLAMEVFWLSKKFPREELFSLTDQIRRSSRSITANIVEGWAKRQYENVFKKQLLDSIGSCDETKQWLDFALACEYLTLDEHNNLTQRYNELGRMLHSLCDNWKTT